MTSTHLRPNSAELKEAALKELMGPFQHRPSSIELKEITQRALKLDGQDLFDFYCKTLSYYQFMIEGNDVMDYVQPVIFNAFRGIVEDKEYSMDDLQAYLMATSTHALANADPSPFSLKAKEIYSRSNIYKRLRFDPTSVIQIQSEYIAEHLKSTTTAV